MAGLTIEYQNNHAGTVDAKAFGDHIKFLSGKITFDASYPTGGEALDLSAYFAKELRGILFEHSGGYTFEYDRTNKKVKAMIADADATSHAVLVEVADTTDLHELSTYFLAWGL